MNEVEAAWAAGIFEGEGCFGVYPNGGGYWKPVTKVEMTDEDVVGRFHALTGFGNVYAKAGRGGRKDSWVWLASKWDDTVSLVSALLPHLGGRRSAAALNILWTNMYGRRGIAVPVDKG